MPREARMLRFVRMGNWKLGNCGAGTGNVTREARKGKLGIVNYETGTENLEKDRTKNRNTAKAAKGTTGHWDNWNWGTDKGKPGNRKQRTASRETATVKRNTANLAN